jgi:adenylate cyclase
MWGAEVTRVDFDVEAAFDQTPGPNAGLPRELRSVRLEDIPSCFEGIIPSSICTVAADGTPNITYISVVYRLDEEHVVLSRQFFKKTEENTGVNPLAQVQLVEPSTGRQFLLDLEYERTETSGRPSNA